MSDGPVLGIDLGTTNSVVAIADGDQSRVLVDLEARRMVPSVVSFTEDGQTLVGYDARDQRLVDAENTVYAVKRLIGRPYGSPEVARARERFGFDIVESKHGGSMVQVRQGRYALAEISAIVLRQLRRMAQADLGVPCDRAVITVPANFNELQRSATKAAGKVAGLDVLRILNEPTAAALAYGYGAESAEKVVVYDLGGGTFDVTVLELDKDVFEVLATAGDTFLGGEDLDGAIADVMSDAFQREHGSDPREDRQAFERLKAAAEWAKCQLSSTSMVELTVEDLLEGKGPFDLQFRLTRAGLEEVVRPWLERSLKVCDEALATAKLSPTEVQSVVLVGGSTRMPLVHSMVEAYFGETPRSDIDPDLVVAQGAAIHGFAVGGGAAKGEAPGQTPLAKVQLKRKTRAEARQKLASKRQTNVGAPRQPAFAPERAAQGPVSKGEPRPDRPAPIDPTAPPVLSSKVVEVRTPRTTLDAELDDLVPPEDLSTDSTLDALAPPESWGDLDEFLPTRAIVSKGTLPGIDDPLADALPPPGRKKHIQSREPTAPFVLEKHAPKPEPAKPAALATPFEAPAEPGRAPAAPFEAPPEPQRAMATPLEALPAAARALATPFDTPFAPTLDAAHPGAAPLAPTLDATPQPGRALATPFEPPEPAAQPEYAQMVVPMPEAAPPILMDVTPHSLGVETAGGYARQLIAKNAPVPTEQTRSFTTARDDQSQVAVRICQGESRVFAENQELGEVVLSDLPSKARGELHIEVAFILDADGTLAVEAKDAVSGRAQKIRIDLSGGLSEADIAGMRLRLEADDL